MDVEINTLVSESLQGGREQTLSLRGMTLNMATKRGLKGCDVNWYLWIAVCVKHVSAFLLQGK